MRFWLLICLFVANNPAMAGLFADGDAREQIKQLEVRVIKLEKALAASDADKEQSIRSTLDLQIQMETLNAELRKLRGQNEEFRHDLQDAEKRQKDFYIDLDTRLRRIEKGAAGNNDVSAVDERSAFEAAYAFYKAEKYKDAAAAFSDFLKHYPRSVHKANVLYWMGNSYFLLRDCRNSLRSYQKMIGKYQDHPRVKETMLNMADCQLKLKKKTTAKRTLKRLISNFPGSDAAKQAKKRLATIK